MRGAACNPQQKHSPEGCRESTHQTPQRGAGASSTQQGWPEPPGGTPKTQEIQLARYVTAPRPGPPADHGCWQDREIGTLVKLTIPHKTRPLSKTSTPGMVPRRLLSASARCLILLHAALARPHGRRCEIAVHGPTPTSRGTQPRVRTKLTATGRSRAYWAAWPSPACRQHRGCSAQGPRIGPAWLRQRGSGRPCLCRKGHLVGLIAAGGGVHGIGRR